MKLGKAERALTTGQRMAYSIGNFGVGLLPSIVGSWAMYYYAPPPKDESCLISYVPIWLIGGMLAIGRVAEAILNPFIGDISDKAKTRWGRRIPFVLFGSPIMVLAMILIWFPPIAGESYVNAVWVCFWGVVLSCAFAAVVAPYLSLLPELTPHNNERLDVSALMALFEVMGVLVAAAGAGMLIDEYKCGIGPFGAQEFNGFQLAGILFGLITLAAFWVTAFGVREGEYTESKDVKLPLLDGMKEVFKNRSFPPYLALVTFFRIAIDMVVVVIPYVVTTVMGGSESDAAAIMLVVMIGAVALLPIVNRMSVKMGKKAVTLMGCFGFIIILPSILTIGMIPGISPMAHGYIIFAFATFPVAVFNLLPRPMLADVIDYDEELTGFRREAMYNGMEGLFTRSGSGFAWFVSSQLFFIFGNSVENPFGILLTGPVGGGLVLIGTLLFLKYPFKD